MEDITIYSKDDVQKAVVKSVEYDGTFMGDRYVTVSVSSPTPVEWEVGDYLEYRDEVWTMWLLPATSKVSGRGTYGGAFEYKDLRFCPNEEELRHCSFLDVVLDDNKIHYTNLPNFSFYCAMAKDLGERIKANLDRLYTGDKEWTILVAEGTTITDQSLTFNNNSCWEALAQANTTLDINFTIDSANRTIVLGGSGERIDTEIMQYGHGNGLKAIERTVDTNQQVVNRLYAYGNTRNLPYRYYNNRYSGSADIIDRVKSMYLPNLMLPGICTRWDVSDSGNPSQYDDGNGEFVVGMNYGSDGRLLTFDQGLDNGNGWYYDADDNEYEGTVYTMFRHFTLNDSGTTYYCDRVWIESEDSVRKCGIQEGTKFFDGSDDEVDDIYPSITGFASSAELLYAIGIANAIEQNLIGHEQGALDEIMEAVLMQSDNWDWSGVIPEEQTQTPQFHIRIKNIGFDLSDAELDASGDTPRLSMKSGMCTGREFNILDCTKQVKVNGVWQNRSEYPNASGEWSYWLRCEAVADDSIGQYFPNTNFMLHGSESQTPDKFVILGIKMPDIYVDVAENRLLSAAIVWLSENDKTQYTYSPTIDNIYMVQNENISSMLKEGNVMLVQDADLGIDIEMTISQLKIKNDKQIPEYEVTLSNDKEADLVQRVSVQVRQSYSQLVGNASSGKGGLNVQILGMGSTAAPTDRNVMSASRSLSTFLRKDINDTASGKITFNAGTQNNGDAKFGTFEEGWIGSGAKVTSSGDAEFNSVNVRGAIRAAELVFNRISAEEGEVIRSIGHGTILSVDEENFTATLKLEGNEIPTIEAGDICRGIYNTYGTDITQEDDGVDGNGFQQQPGFFTSYFYVVDVYQDGDEWKFTYSLQEGSNHPCALMKFAVYGNNIPGNDERQSCMYITATGIAPRLMFLAGVDDWQIQPSNIKAVLGNLNDVVVGSGDELSGDAGLFVEDNVYLGGVVEQLTSYVGVPWVETSVEQVVLNCTGNGQLVSDPSYAQIEMSLHWNDDICYLTSVGVIAPGVSRNQIISQSAMQTSYTQSISISQEYLQPGSTIEVTLSGVDGNGMAHTASKSIPIVQNRAGQDGSGIAIAGTVATLDLLEGIDSPNEGDCWVVEETGEIYVWDGSEWVNLGQFRGSDGKGIVSIVSYYLKTTMYTGVSMNTEPGRWTNTYEAPDEDMPYVWRYTETTYTYGDPSYSACELITTYSVSPNINLLDDTAFANDESMDAWHYKGTVINDPTADPSDAENFNSRTYDNNFSISTGTGGHNAYSAVFKGTAASGSVVHLLGQRIKGEGVVDKLKYGEWYTLSFWANSYDMSTNAELDININFVKTVGEVMYFNGTQMQASDHIYIREQDGVLTRSWKKFVVTFKSIAVPAQGISNYYINFDMPDKTQKQTLSICMPKLELGMVATEYTSGGSSNESFPRASEWAAGKSYCSGSVGERYKDMVIYQGAWFQCMKSHISDTGNRPDGSVNQTMYWRKGSKMEFLATQVFFAEEAKINNLVSDIIRTGTIGTPHVEMHDDVVQFYGKGVYPSIELMVDENDSSEDAVGVLRFFDKYHNPLYDLGPGGILENFSQVQPSNTAVAMKAVTSASDIRNIDDASDQTTYYNYHEGYSSIRMGDTFINRYAISGNATPSQWNNKWFTQAYTGANVPSATKYIPNGMYTDFTNGMDTDSIFDVHYELSPESNLVGALLIRFYNGSKDKQRVVFFQKTPVGTPNQNKIYDESGTLFPALQGETTEQTLSRYIDGGILPRD